MLKADVSKMVKGSTATIEAAGEVKIPTVYGFVGETAGAVIAGTVEYDGVVYKLIGKVTAEYTVPCDRCLKETKVVFEFELTECFARLSAGLRQCETDNTGDNTDDIIFFENELDLTDVVVSGVLMEMPRKTVCKDDCLGLCRFCGQDLNETSCGCDEGVDSKLSILRELWEVE